MVNRAQYTLEKRFRFINCLFVDSFLIGKIIERGRRKTIKDIVWTSDIPTPKSSLSVKSVQSSKLERERRK